MEISIVTVESGPPAVAARRAAEAVRYAVYDHGPVLPHDPGDEFR